MKASATSFKGTPKTPRSVGVGYSDDVFTKADLPWPEFRSISVRAKFLPPPDGQRDTVLLGYVAEIVTAPLAPSKIPERYKKVDTIQTAAGPAVGVPLTQSTFRVHFTLELLDKDGFAVAQASAPAQHVVTGTTNTFQEQLSDKFPLAVARRVVDIRANLSVDECESCRR
jgi:hypothetical protein